MQLKFIHAADLHLDAPFSGLSQNAPLELVRQLKEATYQAFDRLIDLCRLEKPDFLILAGDTYNQEDFSLKAQLHLRDACLKLQGYGTMVYIVQGNHDPLSSRLQSINWPENVVLFGSDVESHNLVKHGQVVATIYGVSHNSSKETRNLARQFKRGSEPGLHLGILHTTLADSDGQNRYAPCSIDDLQASGLDYFALGHVHEHRVICQEPLSLYPGCLQGLHINETGAKGCVIVQARPKSQGLGYDFEYHHEPLAPVLWQSLEIDLEKISANQELAADQELTLDQVDSILNQAVDKIDSLENTLAIIARIKLVGRTSLDAKLHDRQIQSDLLARLQQRDNVWIKDLQIQTKPAIDYEFLRERSDIVGEIFRLAYALEQGVGSQETEIQAVQTKLTLLFDHAKARKVLTPLNELELLAALTEAKNICLNLLEQD